MRIEDKQDSDIPPRSNLSQASAICLVGPQPAIIGWWPT